MKIALMTMAACAALAPATFAQQDGPTLEGRIRSALEGSCRALTIGEDSLGGPGGAWLVEEASAARFTLIGESHLTAETPAFTGALLHELKPAGYGSYVVESGPVATRLVVEAIEESELPAAERLLTEKAFGIAFLDQREEMRAVEAALDLGYDVWGIDQEFVGSPRLLLGELVELAEDESSHDVAQSMLDRARAGFAHFAKTGDQSKAFIMTATPRDYDRLHDSFRDEGGEALEIIEQLRASSAIYGAYNEQRYYDNNSARIAHMKKNLLAHIERAGETPLTARKMVFKAGTYHMGRGFTPVHVLDIGNFASELANASGSESFHVVVTAKGRVAPDGSNTDFAELAPHFGAMLELTGEDSAAVFDLRPLRAILTQTRRKSGAMQDLQDLALSYDAVVVLPRFTQADAVVPLPNMPR